VPICPARSALEPRQADTGDQDVGPAAKTGKLLFAIPWAVVHEADVIYVPAVQTSLKD